MCLDMYLASVDEKEHRKIMRRIKPLRHKPHPLMSWDISGYHVMESIALAPKMHDFTRLKEYADHYGWKIDLKMVFDKEYDAIVLTDDRKQIQWASKGFKAMTGYTVAYAKGKTPTFLQGEKTEEEVKATIREHIRHQEPFQAAITNYRKNGEDYICHIDVVPLLTKKSKVTHFLAFEKELDADINQ